MKTIIYRSTFQQSLGDFLEELLTEQEHNMFAMLWNSYRIPSMLKSSYFEMFRVGDGKYTLSVQKYVNEQWCVKFIINESYYNGNERFTGSH